MPQTSRPDKKRRLNLARLRYLALAAVLLILLTPNALITSVQITARAFVTTIGVDRADDGGYEATAQLVLPQSSADAPQTQDFVSAKGKTLKAAIDGISAKTGKNANLAHCKLVFLGQGVLNDGLMDSLDFFLRAPEINNGLMIAAADGAAKDAVKRLSGFDKLSAFSLPDFLSQNSTNELTSTVTLKDFTEKYYGGAGGGGLIMPVLDIIEKSDEEKAEGGETDGNPEFPSARLSGEFKTAVIKDGRPVKILDGESTRKLLWLDKRAKRGTLLLENFRFGGGDQILSLDIKNKRVKLKTAFKDGKPVCAVSISLKLSLYERQANGGRNALTHADKKRLAADIAAAARQKLNAEINELREVCADGGFDIMGVNESFFRFQNKKYKAYRAGGGDVLKDCLLTVNVKSDVKI